MEGSAVGGTIVTPVRKRRRLPRTALTWMAVTPFAAWAVARVAGLERGSLPTQLMTATPYAAAGSLLPLMIAALGRRRAATVVALLASAALGFSVLPRALGTADAAAKGRPMRVMTVNMLFGKADAATIVRLVREFQPDVLSTQELTPGAVEDLDAAGLTELMPYRVLEAEWNASGSGLFSRHRMEPLAGWSPPAGHHMPAATIALPGGEPVEFIDAHPYPPLGPQVTDWERALESFPPASPDRIRIIAGDFNASLDHSSMRRVLSRGYKDAADEVGAGLIPTWPANKKVPPLITIDHVLVDRRVGVQEVSVRDVPFTDHRAVLARLIVP